MIGSIMRGPAYGVCQKGPTVLQPLTLTCHPATPCTALHSARGLARRADDRLELEFTLAGDIGSLRLPQPALARRAAGLWHHTCLEAFVGTEGQAPYLEINLAPSGEWAAWAFDDYRDGMREAPLAAPRIETRVTRGGLVVRADLDLGMLPTLAGARQWQVGLTAVIEHHDGTLSYWALAHSPGKPDFHAAAGRTCVLMRRRAD
jgi:hypothetical protein